MAEQEEPVRRRVALKVIKLGMDTKSVIARFEAERQALAMMDHPNIAKVLDAGATDMGRPYFVMELVRGIKMTDYCDENNLSTRGRLGLFIQVCQAIQHAHQKGVIHRDIKPSNILVTINDGVPVPKVIDFGIAKATQGRLTDRTLFTAFEQFIGTPAYMSPEQAVMTSLDVDTRSDIYSLGVLLYELLTGRTPFDDRDLLASGLESMRRTICEQEPVKPSTRLTQELVAADVRRLHSKSEIRELKSEEEIRASSRRLLHMKELIRLVRGDLDWIVMKCLAKERTRRYETANDLAMDVQRYLTDEAVVACPPSTAYRLQKAWRRNKLALTAAAVMAAVLIVGVTISTWQAIEASRSRNAEKEQRLAAQAAQKEAESAHRAEKQERLRAETSEAEARRLLYVDKLNLAKQAWDQNDTPRLRQLLQETRDSPDRSFEWYYWQRQSHLALRTLRGHLDIVNSVAFSSDGKRIVTGSYDHTAKVWEASSGRELLTINAHDDPINSVAFSSDGKRIVTGSDDWTAKVWEAASGRELLTLKWHNAGITSVAFSTDGQRIVTGSRDKTAKVWEAASGRELLTLKGHKAGIMSVAFSLDGQRIVTGSYDHTAKVWEAASGRELLAFKGHTDLVSSVAFSPDGQRIVTASFDHTAKVWAAADGRELLTLNGHKFGIMSVAFSQDGQRIVTGGMDRTAKVWDATDGRELLTLKQHDDGISSVNFSSDGQRIVTGSYDRTAKVWEATGDRELLTLKGHSHPIFAAAFSPDGQRIVTGGMDTTAKVWDATDGRELLTLKPRNGEVRFVSYSPDGQRVVTGGTDGTIKVWEAASGRELLAIKGNGWGWAPLACSPDGERIVTGSDDTTSKVWDATTGRELLTFKGHHRDGIESVAFSPDGQRIVTGSVDGTAKVWEAASGRELFTFKAHRYEIESVAFSPDGQRIVTGSDEAKVWEAASGRELLTLTWHDANVSSVSFSPDGRRIVTANLDGTAKVWEAASGRELLTLAGQGGFGLAAFSPDGQRIVTTGVDSTAKVWEAARGEQVAVWQEEERVAAQRLAALQPERTAEGEIQRVARARDAGAIMRWLILAPIRLTAGQSGVQGLDVEQMESEARLRPRTGEARPVGGGELKWQAVALKDYAIDFNRILGHQRFADGVTQSVAYAVCYLRSETEQRGLQMLVGSDDEAKVYLNGEHVHRSALPRAWVADQDRVPDITLNAGLNSLVFKVVNEFGEWKGSIRFTDVQGNPVKGIKVTLDPEAKDSP
jgi:WD40 repeat protein